MKKANILNEKGMTLIELIVSILISSILITMLISLLTMALKAKADLDVNNRMSNESYVITETIRYNIFELGAQLVEEVADTGNLTVIKISHIEDPTFIGEDAGVITNTETYDLLIINTTNIAIDYNFTLDGIPITYTIDSYSIYYNDERMNSANTQISGASSLSVFGVDPFVCGPSPLDACTEPSNEGSIELTLWIEVVMENGSILPAQRFTTKIIV